MTAAESELRGLETIYSDDNVRVRALRARTEELRRQLRKLSGGSSESAGELNSGELYPSVRKLPLLAAAYSNLYRRTKVQETVFEILTRQYEAARVQEAKEIPTVKVLDAADVPEKKSYPPRLLIVMLGLLVSLSAGAMFIFGQAWYRSKSAVETRLLVDSILREITTSLRLVAGRFRRAPANGSIGISESEDSQE